MGLASAKQDATRINSKKKLKQRLTMELAPDNKMQLGKPNKNCEAAHEYSIYTRENDAIRMNKKLKIAHKHINATGKQDAARINFFKYWKQLLNMSLASAKQDSTRINSKTKSENSA